MFFKSDVDRDTCDESDSTNLWTYWILSTRSYRKTSLFCFLCPGTLACVSFLSSPLFLTSFKIQEIPSLNKCNKTNTGFSDHQLDFHVLFDSFFTCILDKTLNVYSEPIHPLLCCKQSSHSRQWLEGNFFNCPQIWTEASFKDILVRVTTKLNLQIVYM